MLDWTKQKKNIVIVIVVVKWYLSWVKWNVLLERHWATWSERERGRENESEREVDLLKECRTRCNTQSQSAYIFGVFIIMMEPASKLDHLTWVLPSLPTRLWIWCNSIMRTMSLTSFSIRFICKLLNHTLVPLPIRLLSSSCCWNYRDCSTSL